MNAFCHLNLYGGSQEVNQVIAEGRKGGGGSCTVHGNSNRKFTVHGN